MVVHFPTAIWPRIRIHSIHLNFQGVSWIESTALNGILITSTGTYRVYNHSYSRFFFSSLFSFFSFLFFFLARNLTKPCPYPLLNHRTMTNPGINFSHVLLAIDRWYSLNSLVSSVSRDFRLSRKSSAGKISGDKCASLIPRSFTILGDMQFNFVVNSLSFSLSLSLPPLSSLFLSLLLKSYVRNFSLIGSNSSFSWGN